MQPTVYHPQAMHDYSWMTPEWPPAGARSGRATLFWLSAFLLVLYLRPADYIPGVAAIRPALTTVAILVVVWLSEAKKIVWIPFSTGKCVLGLLAMAFISIPFSYWPGQSFNIATDLVKQTLIFVILVNIVNTPKAVRWVLYVLCTANACLAVLAVRQYLSGDFDQRITGAVGGAFGDPNDLALSLVVSMPLAWWLFLTLRSKMAKLFWVGIILVLAAGVVATQSRGGFLAMMVVGFFIWKESPYKAPVALTAVVAAVLLAIASPAGTFDRIQGLSNYQEDESARIRLHMWESGVRMFLDHPLQGVGIGVFAEAYGQDYIDPNFPNSKWRAAHNSLVEVAAELGLLGLIFWVGLFVTCLSWMRRTRRQVLRMGPDDQILPIFQFSRQVSACLIGFFAGAIFLSRAYDWVLFILLGLGVASVRMMQSWMDTVAAAQEEVPYMPDEAPVR